MVAATPAEKPISDRELERRISFHLAETHRAGLKSLAVKVVDGRVQLRGRVSSFYEKQLAIHSCQSAAGLTRPVDAADVAVAK